MQQEIEQLPINLYQQWIKLKYVSWNFQGTYFFCKIQLYITKNIKQKYLKVTNKIPNGQKIIDSKKNKL